MDQQKLHELRVFAAEIRLETLKIIGSRGFGHVGGSMSMADAMAVLYGAVMNIDPKNPRWEGRDWFVLSKGHGGPVMYATLGLKARGHAARGVAADALERHAVVERGAAQVGPHRAGNAHHRRHPKVSVGLLGRRCRRQPRGQQQRNNPNPAHR